MIYITGDIHGDPSRLGSRNLLKLGIDITKDDYVIICGDFGIIWNNPLTKKEIYWLDWLAEKPFTTLVVDGNHENFDLLNSYPVVGFMGGQAHKISENVYHLMRGEVFEIEGKKIFSFGGATSTDKEGRMTGVSWWPQEVATMADFINAENNLKRYGYNVDYVVTHTAPRRFIADDPYCLDRVAKCPTSIALSQLEPKISYKQWYFGHFHEDYYDPDSVAVWMYRNIRKLGK